MGKIILTKFIFWFFEGEWSRRRFFRLYEELKRDMFVFFTWSYSSINAWNYDKQLFVVCVCFFCVFFICVFRYYLGFLAQTILISRDLKLSFFLFYIFWVIKVTHPIIKTGCGTKNSLTISIVDPISHIVFVFIEK